MNGSARKRPGWRAPSTPGSHRVSVWAKGRGSHPGAAEPAAAGSTTEREKEPRATHLTEKRWAGRSPPPGEGSPRPTVLSPASFFGSLRSRADNYMSKWHIPFRARGGDPSARRAWGREGNPRATCAVHPLRAGATESAPAGPGPGTGGGGECARWCARVGVCSSVCAWGSGPDCAAIFPCEPLLSRSLLTFSHWLVNNKKEGGKRFPKKVDCKEAVGFRPLPPAGLCSAPFSVSLHLQSKLGGNGRAAGGKLLASPPILSFFFLSAFLTLVRRLR